MEENRVGEGDPARSADVDPGRVEDQDGTYGAGHFGVGNLEFAVTLGVRRSQGEPEDGRLGQVDPPEARRAQDACHVEGKEPLAGAGGASPHEEEERGPWLQVAHVDGDVGIGRKNGAVVGGVGGEDVLHFMDEGEAHEGRSELRRVGLETHPGSVGLSALGSHGHAVDLGDGAASLGGEDGAGPAAGVAAENEVGKNHVLALGVGPGSRPCAAVGIQGQAAEVGCDGDGISLVVHGFGVLHHIPKADLPVGAGGDLRQDAEGEAVREMIIGYQLLRSKEKEQAAEHLLQAVKLDRKSRVLKTLYAEALFELHRFDEVIKLLEPLAGEKDSVETQMLKLLAFSCQATWQMEKAVDYYKRIIKQEPQDDWIRRRLLELLKAQGRFQEIIPLYKPLLDPRSDTYARDLFQMGALYLKIGGREPARQYLEKAIAADSSLADGRVVKFTVLSLFPGILRGFFDDSIMSKAVRRGLVDYELVNIRDYAYDRHRVCDDSPYGGGAGMVLKPEPLSRALDAVGAAGKRVVFPTPSGRSFTQDIARDLSGEEELIFICGRYEGIDQRVINLYVDDEISIGDYVISSGEISTLVMVDAIYRLLDGVITRESLEEESFTQPLLEYPHFTRPEDFRGLRVPEILLGGHHANIEAWRLRQRVEKTLKNHPDLLEADGVSEEIRRISDELRGTSEG